MNNDQMVQWLREAMTSVDVCPSAVKGPIALDDTLASLGIDSIAALEIAACLEDRLGVQFPDDELSGLSDVRSLVLLMGRYAPAQGAPTVA